MALRETQNIATARRQGGSTDIVVIDRNHAFGVYDDPLEAEASQTRGSCAAPPARPRERPRWRNVGPLAQGVGFWSVPCTNDCRPMRSVRLGESRTATMLDRSVQKRQEVLQSRTSGIDLGVANILAVRRGRWRAFDGKALARGDGRVRRCTAVPFRDAEDQVLEVDRTGICHARSPRPKLFGFHRLNRRTLPPHPALPSLPALPRPNWSTAHSRVIQPCR